jgi:hypothetical protein
MPKSQKKNRRKDKKTLKKKKKNIKTLVLQPKMLESELAEKEGHYFEENHYDNIITTDCDGYRVDKEGNKHLLFRFRKNVIPIHECKVGMDCLKEASLHKHDNRGAAAGILDPLKMPLYANDPTLHGNKERYRVDGYYSKTTGKFINNSTGNLSQSNIIGYFDRRDRNQKGIVDVPCRKTAFTRDEVEKWNSVQPLLNSIDKQFKILIPDRHAKQYKIAQMTDFKIGDTAFSTITINNNWRTALHKDAGDFPDGFGNLIVLEEGKYTGGYTGFPQYGVCIDVREGDFLGMDVHQFHCNTEIKPLTKDYTRLSIVAYLREKMIECSKKKSTRLL